MSRYLPEKDWLSVTNTWIRHAMGFRVSPHPLLEELRRLDALGAWRCAGKWIMDEQAWGYTSKITTKPKKEDFSVGIEVILTSPCGRVSYATEILYTISEGPSKTFTMDFIHLSCAARASSSNRVENGEWEECSMTLSRQPPAFALNLDASSVPNARDQVLNLLQRKVLPRAQKIFDEDVVRFLANEILRMDHPDPEWKPYYYWR